MYEHTIGDKIRYDHIQNKMRVVSIDVNKRKAKLRWLTYKEEMHERFSAKV